MSNAVTLTNVRKSYGDFVAVNDLSLEIRQGCIFGLLGPNGAGKTTTIRMIVNITMPDAGEVRLFGERMSAKLQERVGYLPEDRGLYKKMKVGEQLAFFAELKGLGHEQSARLIDEWLERVSLTEWKNKRWDELSKGMQQKVQFVSTIMHDPELVILDEPFSGLDPINANLLKEVVHDMKRRNRTIIFSTHLMEQAEQMCDEICLINRGRKVLDGNVREIKRGFGHRAIALEGENFDGLLDNPALVRKANRFQYHVEVELEDGANPQELLRALVNGGAKLTRFEMVEPSLNEIFIESVNRTNA
ncbi:MAG TPA: ATP-binding cassette domain-containing protein [Blastocatellia bacterium]|nr:ATP-binding cassette domain-containing protein [Blastocatellia bacterium]